MAAAPASPKPAPATRLQSVDALRGAIMMLMAIDHIRDYVARSAMQFSPTDLTRTTPAIFLTRWITHFCAPVFFLTAGMGAFLWMTRGNRTKAELSRFLVTRGLWLIFIELTLLRPIMFSQLSYHGSIIILLILWAIGVSMIALAGMAHLPARTLAAVSLGILVLHNSLDSVSAERFGSLACLWDILHQQALFSFAGLKFVTAYPVLPWIGVMSAGLCLGQTFLWEPAKRRRFWLYSGMICVAAFLVVRALNGYGDPVPRAPQISAVMNLLSFLNTTKYPPSLDFLLMTLGPALCALSYLDRLQFSQRNPLVVFGRVPFLYYVLHLVFAHAAAILMNAARYGWKPFLWLAPPSMGAPAEVFPPNYGFPLWAVYLVWMAILAALYPICLWFSKLKNNRRSWWLGYL